MDIKRIVNNQRGKRMKAWSPMCGGCELSVNKDGVLVAEYGYPATVIYLKGGGKYQDVADAECVIFPDKCQRNWREVENFFIPFEKVLVCNTPRRTDGYANTAYHLPAMRTGQEHK